jgi:hypothetical protein
VSSFRWTNASGEFGGGVDVSYSRVLFNDLEGGEPVIVVTAQSSTLQMWNGRVHSKEREEGGRLVVTELHDHGRGLFGQLERQQRDKGRGETK